MVKTAKFFLFLVLTGTLFSSVGLSGSSYYVSQVLAESSKINRTYIHETNSETNLADSDNVKGKLNVRNKESIPESKTDTIKANHPPKANAGTDITVNEKDNVVLNAEKSTDPDGDKLSYIWSQISPKKPRVYLKDADAQVALFTAPKIDTKYAIFTFLLTVEDGQSGMARDMVKIKINSAEEEQKVLSEPSSTNFLPTPDRQSEESDNRRHTSNINTESNNRNNNSHDLGDQIASTKQLGGKQIHNESSLENKLAIQQAKKAMDKAIAATKLNGKSKVRTSNSLNDSRTDTAKHDIGASDLVPPKFSKLEITSSSDGIFEGRSFQRVTSHARCPDGLPGNPDGGLCTGTQEWAIEFSGSLKREIFTISEQQYDKFIATPGSKATCDYSDKVTVDSTGGIYFDYHPPPVQFIVPVDNPPPPVPGAPYSTFGVEITYPGSGGNGLRSDLADIGIGLAGSGAYPYSSPLCLIQAARDPGDSGPTQIHVQKSTDGSTLSGTGNLEQLHLLNEENSQVDFEGSWTFTANLVDNIPPIADAGVTFPPPYPNGITYSNAGQPVILDGSKSHSESTGITIQTYEWSKIEGPADAPLTLQGVKPTFDFPIFDPIPPNDVNLSYTLKVIDTNGETSKNSAVVTVHLNHPPDPVIVATPTPPVPQLTKVTLDASQSKDIDAGDQLSYNWTQDVADPIKVVLSNPTGPVTEFTAPENETSLLFHLNVKDRSEAESTSFKSIEVKCLAQSTTSACSKPTINVEVNKQEINPYPGTGARPQAEITVTTKNLDGTPAKNVQVEVKACTEVGTANTDGHTHDVSTGDVCFHSTRPKAVLDVGVQNGNPIVTATDDTGIAKITYNSPSSQNNYYISGKDKIIATLRDDPGVTDDSKTIATKVPNLHQMPNSQTCPGGTDTYYFDTQSKHGCLFYGTDNTNSELARIAEVFKQRQVDCTKAKSPRLEPACEVTPNGSKKIDFVKITGNPIPIKITAMSLPWGGLLDISGEWNPSHFTHNDGNNVDVGFNIKGKFMTTDQKKLLRDVIIDSGHRLPYSSEGKEEDVTKATNHFHIEFQNCRSSQTTQLKTLDVDISCKEKITIKGKIFVATPDRKDLILQNLKIQICSLNTSDCPITGLSDSFGSYKLSTDNILAKNAQLRVSLFDKPNDLLVTKYPNTGEATLRISSIEFERDPITGEVIAELNIRLQDNSPYILINNKFLGSGNIPTLSNTDEASFPHLAAIYYYIDRAATYSNDNINIARTFKAPLAIQGFNTVTKASFFDNDHTIVIKRDGSRLADGSVSKPQQTEYKLDALFHEFGHFLNYEYYRGKYPVNTALNPKYSSASGILSGNCHEGYGHIDSSCALNEAKGSFYGALLEDRVLDGLTHTYFKFRASKYTFPSGSFFDFEVPTNIVGTKLTRSSSPFFNHNSAAEEFALASVLWDLFDSTPIEDPAQLQLNDLINSLLTSDTTFDYYKHLISALPSMKGSIDNIFATFGIYVDKNSNGQYDGGVDTINGQSSWQACVGSNTKCTKTPSPSQLYDYSFPPGRN